MQCEFGVTKWCTHSKVHTVRDAKCWPLHLQLILRLFFGLIFVLQFAAPLLVWKLGPIVTNMLKHDVEVFSGRGISI